MENKPAGAGPIEEAISDIGSLISAFTQLKADAVSITASAKKAIFYGSVACWVLAGAAGYAHRRRKLKKD